MSFIKLSTIYCAERSEIKWDNKLSHFIYMWKEKYYDKIMNDISILQETYNRLKIVTETNNIQVNDTLYTEPNKISFNGKVTILDPTPVLSNITDGALYISDTLTSENNIISNYGITNKGYNINSVFNKSNVNNLYNNYDVNFGNIISNNIYCKEIIMNKMLEANLVIGNELYIEQGLLTCGKIYFNNGNIYGNSKYYYVNGTNILSDKCLGSMNSNIIIVNMLDNINNVKLKKNINLMDTRVIGDLNFKKISSNIITEDLIVKTNGTIEIFRGDLEINTINSNIITTNLYVTGITQCNSILLNNYEINYTYNLIPLCIDQDKLRTITYLNLYFYGYKYNNSFSFCVTDNIVFQNLSGDFKFLTLFYDDQLPELVQYKPNKKYSIIVSGFRNFGLNTYSVMYMVDFFSMNDKQININILSDENNEFDFKSNYIYYIYKFNSNYII